MKTPAPIRLLLVLLVLTTGCSGELWLTEPETRADAAVTPDSDPDAGVYQRTDAAPIGRDAGANKAEAGPPPLLDAGTVDAGEPDAGEIPSVVPPCRIDLSTYLGPLGAPGLSAGLVKGGRLVCTAAAGQADREAGRPVNPDTLFGWASVSKTVTAAAIMILYDEGRFGLDDSVSSYLPFDVQNPSCSSGLITFRQLLTHTSSILDTSAYDDFYIGGDVSATLGEFVEGYVVPGGEYYTSGSYDFACPGEYADYSNVAVALLGYLVERISGVPFDQFCRDRIFAPLGMTESSFLLSELDVSHVAVPYEGSNRLDHLYPTNFADGSGSLRTSVPQLARFLAMMTGDGIYQGRRILEPGTVREMFRPQIPSLDPVQGLIWYTGDFGGHPGLLGHDGSDPGGASLMFFDPTSGAGALLVGNGDWWEERGTETAALNLFSALMDEATTW